MSKQSATPRSSMGPPKVPSHLSFKKFRRKFFARPAARKAEPHKTCRADHIRMLQRPHEARELFRVFKLFQYREEVMAETLKNRQRDVLLLEKQVAHEQKLSKNLQEQFEQLGAHRTQAASPITAAKQRITEDMDLAMTSAKRAVLEEERGLHTLKTNVALAKHRLCMGGVMVDKLEWTIQVLRKTLRDLGGMRKQLEENVALKRRQTEKAQKE